MKIFYLLTKENDSREFCVKEIEVEYISKENIVFCNGEIIGHLGTSVFKDIESLYKYVYIQSLYLYNKSVRYSNLMQKLEDINPDLINSSPIVPKFYL